MSVQPYFSIVIPAYNRGYLLKEVLDFALSQAFLNFEVILVDDGSSDNTRELVLGITDVRIKYVYQDNRERAAARNLGASVAQGRYITFCDSDDKLYPWYLEEAMKLIERHGEIPWLHIGYEIIRSDRPVFKMNAACSDIRGVLARGNPLSCLGVFVRKDIFMNHLFNEDRQLSGSEDWELWLRLSAHYELKYSVRSCAALVLHSGRSVMNTSELKLQLRKFLSISYALEDEMAMKVYGPNKNLMYAYCDTYTALHLVLEGKTLSSFKFILSAMMKYPLSLFSRRMLAIIKISLMNLLQLR